MANLRSIWQSLRIRTLSLPPSFIEQTLHRTRLSAGARPGGRTTMPPAADLTLHRSKRPETRSTEVSSHVIVSAFMQLLRADLMAECEANSTRVDLRAPSDAST